MPLYGAIDLHSNNNYVVVIDDNEQVLLRRREPNRLETVLRDLQPFRSELVGLAVESTYNWYWLVDGLAEAGYRMHLVNTAAIQQYAGLKYSDDWSDTLWLARLLRLGVLPEGYIYPRQQRPVRDLLRKRSQLVRQRTAQLLSVGNILTRNTGVRVSRTELKELTVEEVGHRLSQPQVALSADCSLQVAWTLDKQIDRIEQEVHKQLKLDRAAHKTLRLLQTVWGVGEVLGRAILLETGPVNRFPTVGDYSSYCRAVGSQCWSNGRLKGENNAKCGNRYLAWAFVEAANYAAHSYQQAQAFVARKTAQTNRALAVKALANKLCRASYWVMKEQVKFEPARLFGSLELAGTEEPENRLAPSHEFDWTSVPAVCFPRHLGCRGGRRRPDRKPLSVWSLTFGLRRTFDVVAAVDDSSAPAASAWIRSGTHAFLGPQAKARDGWREVGLAPAGR